jgi:hypothetical protein
MLAIHAMTGFNSLLDRHSLALAILVTVFSLFASGLLERPPVVTPLDAPPVQFSGERAMSLLKHFLAEDLPHPVGSAQNRIVKRRIQAWLDQQGIAHEEQGAWGCRGKWHECAYAENIIATLPGSVPGPYVALMAHYDSVRTSSGAGDDMAGVVAVLETARAIRAAGGYRHPLMLIITDAEESGLQGAEAFFSRHPLADQVAVILNVEGSGTRGQSQVLRTSMPNAWYMELFGDSASHPFGSSLANEVFRHMPNDTDFSVAMAARVPGIDFAFAGERNHYHTLNDNPGNLDPRTIEHHGANLFPLALRLANADLTSPGIGRVVYQNAYGGWFSWPLSWSPWLLGLTGALLLATSARRRLPPLQLALLVIAVPIAVLAGGGALVQACVALLERLHGTTVDWPAHLWAFRLVLYMAAAVPALLLARMLAPRLSASVVLLCGWWFWWLLAVLLQVFFADAAAILLLPVLGAVPLLTAAEWLPPSAARVCRLATLVPASVALLTARALEETQGFGMAVAIWPWVGLYLVAALAFVRGDWLRPTLVAACALLAAGLLAATTLPLYSTHRPQHLNVRYVQDHDAGQAVFRLSTGGAAPAAMARTADFNLPGQTIFPWRESRFELLARAPFSDLPAPVLTVENDRPGESGRQVTLRLGSARGAGMLHLILPRTAGARSLEVDGSRMSLTADDSGDESDYTEVYFHGVQARDVVVTLELESTEPVQAWLEDLSATLPASARALNAARPPTAVPVHNGDLSRVFTSVSF